MSELKIPLRKRFKVFLRMEYVKINMEPEAPQKVSEKEWEQAGEWAENITERLMDIVKEWQEDVVPISTPHKKERVIPSVPPEDREKLNEGE